MTRRIVLLTGLLALMIAGCRNNLEGPREVYQKNRRGDRADLPGYNIQQQEQRGRERYTIPSDDRSIGPPTYMDRSDPVGL